MSAPQTKSVIDRDAVVERVGGDAEFLREIAAIFLEDYPRLLSQIRSAILDRNCAALQHAAHTLKGCVANFGADSAREAALRLELLGRAGTLDDASDACGTLETEMERFSRELSALARQLNARQ